jgi:hypothetical protein
MTHRDHRAILAHADNRVVPAVRNVEVGAFFQRGIAATLKITPSSTRSIAAIVFSNGSLT